MTAEGGARSAKCEAGIEDTELRTLYAENACYFNFGFNS